MISTLTPNRLTAAIAAVQAQLDERPTVHAHLNAELAITFDEHFRFQQLQSQAHALGNLSTDEAQLVYLNLGIAFTPDNGGWHATTDLATKVVITQLMGELLQKKLA